MGAALSARAREVRTAAPVEARLALRIVAAAALSWQACVWLGAVQPPVFAVIVPLVAMRDAPDSVLDVSFARVVGVLAGVAVGIGVITWLRPGLVAIALVLLVALALGIVVRVGGALNVQIAVSALLVFANSDPSAFALSRLWETVVGAVVTVVVAALVLPPDPVRAFRAELREVAAQAAADLRLAAALSVLPADDPDRAPRVAELRERTRADDLRAEGLAPRLAAAQRAVRVNPLWRRQRAALTALAPVPDAAADVAALVRVHAEDVVELGARPDARDWWTEAATAARDAATALAPAVEDVLGDPTAARPEALDGADAVLAAHLDADATRLGAVVRRPLNRIARLLRALPAEVGAVPAAAVT